MSFDDNLDALEKAATAYFKAALALHNELELGDTPYDPDENPAKDLIKVRECADNANSFVLRAENIARFQQSMGYHLRARLYVVRRKASKVGTPLLWEEMHQLGTFGPWLTSPSSLEFARKDRDRKNVHENKDRKVRGHTPGAYVWEIWSYDPKIDAWAKED